MDLLTGAATFATITGLLCNFTSEKSSGELSDFIIWLKEKNHEDITRAIESNKSLSAELSIILCKNNNQLHEELLELNNIITGIASKISTFSALANATNPEKSLSHQAISILQQLVDSGASGILEVADEPKSYIYTDANGEINYEEPRFIDSDFNDLTELKLLTLDFGSHGSRIFKITRNAVAFVTAIRR